MTTTKRKRGARAKHSMPEPNPDTPETQRIKEPDKFMAAMVAVGLWVGQKSGRCGVR